MYILVTASPSCPLANRRSSGCSGGLACSFAPRILSSLARSSQCLRRMCTSSNATWSERGAGYLRWADAGSIWKWPIPIWSQVFGFTRSFWWASFLNWTNCCGRAADGTRSADATDGFCGWRLWSFWEWGRFPCRLLAASLNRTKATLVEEVFRLVSRRVITIDTVALSEA